MAGCLLGGLGRRRVNGGIVFGLFVFAGGISLVMNLVWWYQSRETFLGLGTTAWYPFPSLSWGYFLNAGGCLLVLGATSAYGYMVLPEVYAFDKAEEKAEKFEARQARKRMMKYKINWNRWC